MKINQIRQVVSGTGGGDTGGVTYSAGDVVFGVNQPENSVELDGTMKSSNDFPNLSNFLPALNITGNYNLMTDNSTYKNDYDVFGGTVQFEILKQIKHNGKEYVLYATENKENAIYNVTDKLNPVEIMYKATGSFRATNQQFMSGAANCIRQFDKFENDNVAYITVINEDSFNVEFYEMDLDTGSLTVLYSGDFYPPFNDIDEEPMLDFLANQSNIQLIKDKNNPNELYVLMVYSVGGEITLSKLNKTTSSNNIIGSYFFPQDPNFRTWIIYNHNDIQSSLDFNNKELIFKLVKKNENSIYETRGESICRYRFDFPEEVEIIEELISESIENLYISPVKIKESFYYTILEGNFDHITGSGNYEITKIFKYSNGTKAYLPSPDSFFKSLDKTNFEEYSQNVKSIKSINDVLFLAKQIRIKEVDPQDGITRYYEFYETIGFNTNTSEIVFSSKYEELNEFLEPSSDIHLWFNQDLVDFKKIIFDNNTFYYSDKTIDIVNPVQNEVTYDNLDSNYILPKYTGDDQGFIKAYLITQ